MSEFTRSAVALLETSDALIVHHRPDKPGKLAYSDMIHLLGGHAEKDELLREAVVREIGEETNHRPALQDAEFMWEGNFTGEDANCDPITRHVGLFAIDVSTAHDLRLARKEGGHLVYVPKTLEGIAEVDNQLTLFARKALTMRVTGNNQFD